MTMVLTNSPLIYVLGQVRISPIFQIEKYIGDIQENLRAELPESHINKAKVITFDGKEATHETIKQWHFSNIDKTYGIMVQRDSIIIHTTHYDSFAIFSEQLNSAILKIDEILEIGAYNRIGIRYINLITTKIDEYVNNQLLGFHPTFNFNLSKEFFNKTDHVTNTKYGTLKLQSIYTYLNEIADEDVKHSLLPPDLLPAANLLNPKVREKIDEKLLLLDIDHYTKSEIRKFNSDEIKGQLLKLNSCIFDAFKASVSKKAIKAWE